MKKFFFVLVFSSLLFSLNEVRAYTSSDVSNASFLATEGIIVKQSTTAGYRLDNTITRAEVIGMALKIKWITLPSNYTCKNYFIDAPYNPSNNWICRAVELGADDGIISRANTKARPQDSITRVEALAIVARDLENEPNSYSDPTKYIDANSWQIEVIRKAMAQGIINPKIVLGKDMGGLYSWFQERSVYFYPNRLATRAEVFGFVKNMLSSKNACIVGALQIEQPCEIENEFIKYGKYIEVLTYGDEMYKGPECSIGYKETGANPIDAFTSLSLVKYRDGNLDAQYIEAGWFRAVFTSTGYYRITSAGSVDNCMNVPLPNRVSLYQRDVLRLYYENLNTEGGSYWAYLMRSPAGVSLETFRWWYEKVTKVNFQENTLKDLWDNTYEFLINMTENGVKSTYKVKSKVDLENFKINNLSSVKQ